jgi:hypothetical protein
VAVHKNRNLADLQSTNLASIIEKHVPFRPESMHWVEVSAQPQAIETSPHENFKLGRCGEKALGRFRSRKDVA